MGTSIDGANTLPAVQWGEGGVTDATKLGKMMDSYADLLDNCGQHEAGLRTQFCERMSKRGFKEVTLQSAKLKAGGVDSGSLIAEQRAYYLATTPTGATLTVRIAACGNDLYISWYLWVRPLLNMITLLVCLGGGFLISLGMQLSGRGFSIWSLLAGAIGIFFVFLFLTVIAGAVFRRNPLAFLLRTLSFFDSEDIRAASIAVQNSLIESAEAVGLKEKLRPKTDFAGGKRPRLF